MDGVSSESTGAVSSSGFSISLGPRKVGLASNLRKPQSSSTVFSSTNGLKRGAALSDDDDDDDDIHYDLHRDKVQLVTGFGSKGAITEGEPKESQPLVISALKNKDWRAESRKKKGIYLPPEAAAKKSGAAIDTTETINNEPMRVGLQFVEKSTADMTIEEGDNSMHDALKQNAVVPSTETQKSEDQLALEALLSGGKAKSTTLTILSAENNSDAQNYPQNEDEAYRSDVASRPDMASLDDYAAVPVEEFGAALLRGMGWKEGEAIGRAGGAENKARLVERRPALLGIGAKGIGAEEIGAWGKGDKKARQPRPERTYLPVTLVDKNGNRVEEDSGKDSKKDVDKDWRKRDDKERSDRQEHDRNQVDDRDRSYSKGDRDRYRIERGSERDKDRYDREKDHDRYKDRHRRDRDRDSHRKSDRDSNRDYKSSKYDDRDRDRKRYRSRSRSRERRHR